MENNNLLDIVLLVNSKKNNNQCISYADIKPFLNDKMTYFTVSKGDYITTENTSAKKVFYVLSGSIIMMRDSKKGTRFVLAREKAPQFLGMDRAIFSENCVFTNTLALEDCTVLAIDPSYFLKNVKENLDFSFEIVKILCERLLKASYRSDQIVFYTPPEKLMIYIVKYWNQHHTDKKKCVIKEKNALIADAIGVSIRTLYRTINELKEQGLLTMEKGNFVVTHEQVEEMKIICEDLWMTSGAE